MRDVLRAARPYKRGQHGQHISGRRRGVRPCEHPHPAASPATVVFQATPGICAGLPVLLPANMCVGHPKRHPCQHTSVTYNHCVAAHFDGATRVTTPCHNTTYAAPVDSESKCTNQLCFFQELGGSWICCKCGNGPNYVGWCTFDNPRTEVNAITQQLEQVTKCDHCCCWNCTPYCE